jgi:hypothetical protein
MSEHPYDRPDISAREFLKRVMRDPTADIHDRVHAAGVLLNLPPEPQLSLIPHGDQDCTLTIRVPSIDDPEEGHA